MDMMPEPAMELPAPNLPLLRKVLDHIDAHPEEHNQTIWGYEYTWAYPQPLIDSNLRAGRCGTAMCIAGWAMALGAPEAFEDGRWDAEEAAGVLGLTTLEANELFHAANGRLQIQHHAEAIAARAGERL